MTIAKDETIVHPHYGCAVGAAYTVSAIKGGVPIANCGPGCMYKQFFLLCFDNAFQGSAGVGGGNIPSANVSEDDVVFGGMKTLDSLIKSSIAVVAGDLYVVLTGCTGELVGDDVTSVVNRYKRAGYSVVQADVGGFKGSNLVGHEIVVRSIVEQYVGDYEEEKQKGLVNLWFEIPYFNTNWRGDYLEIVRILRGAGLEVNIFWGAQSGGSAAWRNIPKAQFNIVLSTWVGLDIAELLQQKYDQPYLHIPVVPIGEEATTAFVRQVVEFAGIDDTQSEKFIAEEADIYYYFLEHFSGFFSEYWYGLPSKFAVAGNSLDNLALTKFLSDQIGLLPVKQIITDNPPERHRALIVEEFKNLTDGVSVEPEFIEDGYVVEQSLKNTDFGASVPLILGSSWETDIAAEKEALLLEVGLPITEEVALNRSYIGYRGALSLLERIYTATVGGK